MGEASFELDELDSNCFIQSLSSHISQDNSRCYLNLNLVDDICILLKMKISFKLFKFKLLKLKKTSFRILI